MSEARLETGAADYASQVREYLAYCEDAARKWRLAGAGSIRSITRAPMAPSR